MRIRALAVRIWRQFQHDKRTLALMFVAPILILTLVYLVFNGSTYKPKIGTVDLPVSMTQSLATQDVRLYSYASSGSAMKALKSDTIDAYMALHQGRPTVTLEGSDPSVSRTVLLNLQKAMQSAFSTAQPTTHLTVKYLYGSANMSSFDNFGPVLIGFFAFFLVFLVSGMSFLKERTSGTLERLIATPIKRWEIVAGYVVGFGAFTTVQATLIAWYCVDVLGHDDERTIGQPPPDHLPSFHDGTDIGDSSLGVCKFRVSDDAVHSARHCAAGLLLRIVQSGDDCWVAALAEQSNALVLRSHRFAQCHDPRRGVCAILSETWRCCSDFRSSSWS